jgi:hypothetical protein
MLVKKCLKNIKMIRFSSKSNNILIIIIIILSYVLYYFKVFFIIRSIISSYNSIYSVIQIFIFSYFLLLRYSNCLLFEFGLLQTLFSFQNTYELPHCSWLAANAELNALCHLSTALFVWECLALQYQTYSIF